MQNRAAWLRGRKGSAVEADAWAVPTHKSFGIKWAGQHASSQCPAWHASSSLCRELAPSQHCMTQTATTATTLAAMMRTLKLSSPSV